MPFPDSFPSLPLIAILRGIVPDEAVPMAKVLHRMGFRCMEVPLNSPDPFESIGRMVDALGADCLIGAGTVLAAADVERVRDTGGRLIVMPHADISIIKATKQAGMVCAPGVSTLTEAFAALHAGADALKVFPAELITPAVLRAWRSVLPRSVPLVPVGGITPGAMEAFVAAGANGFGLGGALFQPGWTLDEVQDAAAQFATTWRALLPGVASSGADAVRRFPGWASSPASD
ncbi:KDPG and KHG aldolase family protein [Burkholderia pseudomallei]|uniref:KDPG and KHG aldolase family protein n=1 Tax=Burkholderia pseudomallei TaxID=28450 RepID=A0AA40JJ34_BURPE|nr:2-dehydro-3-deoxy-6-phosphogalactonate aldolase [Burkholderia pseudomallei]KGX17243.1 KDPG and KHG aldolase family protein [Burkholderia pseudomallei]